MKYLLPVFFLGIVLAAHGAPKKNTALISTGPGGALVYAVDGQGNRMPDFSSCGYAGGDREIPAVPVRVVVAPVSGDETARIQKALNYVGSLPPDADGTRGAVLLLKGRHEVWGGLQITNSGVVLRGQGMGEDGTILVAAGIDRRTLITLAGQNDWAGSSNANWQVIDDYVPVGATHFHVRDAGGLQVHDAIDVVRPSTKTWIDALGMTEFGGGIGDWRLTWKAGTRDIVWDRQIEKIEGNLITVDAPITTALETNYGGGYVNTYAWPGRIREVGVENIRLVSSFDPANPKDENHAWMAVTMQSVENAWVRQVVFEHFAGSAVAVYETCRRTTVADCSSLAPISEDAGWRRQTFYTLGQQTLFCAARRNRGDMILPSAIAPPVRNAFVQCEASLPSGDSGAIESWAGGVLFDNVRIDGNGLDLMNRGSVGEGAGWSAANSVLWQCDASKIACENPPTARNWAFGCWGEFEGDGIWRDANASVRPASLFVAQVHDRLGAAAAARVNLMQRSLEEYSNPTAAQAARLIADSLKPAPQLPDYIAAAPAREPIPAAAGDAKNVDDLPDAAVPVKNPLHLIAVTNGWLVCDGKLLTGSCTGVNWWRGNMRPSEAGGYGINLTRFAPGRIGTGYTDDLNALADWLQTQHLAALDHHYGLWYDRRREDHERVRRVDGDVWAPFYEQPFARSGQGTAWDGLSRYDLTKFNPWYWSRLQQFAQVCAARGLVLFNENYFQHNIIEAGAHWVDCPWRSANNINGTGFPEPPPFAGDKRIFMASQFYDVTNPARRALHRNFIRQNLANFTNEANVIQFTSAEFTGPLPFEQFWLDTVGEWEQETRNHPLTALCAPKDVQDAILADDQRRAIVDVVCFRYWWQTDQGLFAPRGGQSLSPRQFERQWKGGSPGDLDLAGMVAAYRQKYADKAFIAAGEDEGLSHGSWAFVCAGGSLPNLPVTADAGLLAAIPAMRPCAAASSESRWALCESGRQWLVYSDADAPAEFDLSAESGVYHIHMVNDRTGRVSSSRADLVAGKKVMLPAGVVWLTRD